MKINLHIEQVVLERVDVSAGDRELLRESIAGELGRMLGEEGLTNGLTRGVSVSRMVAGDIQLTANKPVKLGQQIARSVYEGISGE